MDRVHDHRIAGNFRALLTLRVAFPLRHSRHLLIPFDDPWSDLPAAAAVDCPAARAPAAWRGSAARTDYVPGFHQLSHVRRQLSQLRCAGISTREISSTTAPAISHPFIPTATPEISWPCGVRPGGRCPPAGAQTAARRRDRNDSTVFLCPFREDPSVPRTPDRRESDASPCQPPQPTLQVPIAFGACLFQPAQLAIEALENGPVHQKLPPIVIV